jgi:hypothetical protein
MPAGRSAVVLRFFAALADRRRLLALAAVALLSGAAMLPAMRTMSDHGESLFAFEGAGSVERSEEIVSTWGEPGKLAAWWQLALDTPFLIAYGLFAAGACAAVASRAAAAGKVRLRQAAELLIWFGPLAAAADLLQNLSLAMILTGHVVQPWPRISAVCGSVTTSLMAIALIFALGGWLVTGRAGGTTTAPPAAG